MATISTIQFKRGNKAILEKVLKDDKMPLQGEPVFELDTNKIKIGDGVHNYIDLPYASGSGTSEDTIVYKSYLEFPPVGKDNVLYVATDENNSYRWVSAETCYKLVTVDSRQIDGGNASTWTD